MLIGLRGKAGSGKDTVAHMLTAQHLVRVDNELLDIRARLRAPGDPAPKLALLGRDSAQIAFADPLKTICRQVYKFPLEALWGPSEMRNKPDPRYPRTRGQHVFYTPGSVFKFEPEPSESSLCRTCGIPYGPAVEATPCVDYLTPREALQRLGTEWGRTCFENTWVETALRFARELTHEQNDFRDLGRNYDSVVVSDLRFVNEAKRLREAGGEVWCVRRPQATGTGSARGDAHASETTLEADLAPFTDRYLENVGDLEDLYQAVRNLCLKL